MKENIICPYCNTDMNKYKCEYKCNDCDTIFCLICNNPFFVINSISHQGHRISCYLKLKLKSLSKL